MISNSYNVNASQTGVETTSPVVPLNNSNRRRVNVVLRWNQDSIVRSRDFTYPQNTRLVNPEPVHISYPKVGSCPNGFLVNFSESKNAYQQDTSSESLSVGDSDEDTESFFGSGDGDELANEIKSRNDADDELATLFGSDDACASKSCVSRMANFQRPLNPIVNDKRFTMARCSAPSLEEQPMSSLFTKTRSEGYNRYSPFE